MSYYHKCPSCGANLDPGEKCDCQKGKGPCDTTRQHSPKIKSKASIAQDPEDVKAILLKNLRTSKNIPAKEMVKVVRQVFPKYDKTLQSKCERSAEYGVGIRTKALDAILEKYAPELLAKEKHRRDGGHKLKCRVMCRLPESTYIRLLERIKEDGFKTVQEWLSCKIVEYITDQN